MSAQPTPATKRGSRLADWLSKLGDFFLHVIAQDRVLKRIYPGVMHVLIFWGMTIQVLGTAVNLMQTPLFLPFELPFPRGAAYLWFELVMDLGGGMIVLGVLMAVFRRAVLRPKYLVNRWDDWYVLGLLLLIPLLGFSSEAVRLQTVAPEWRAWAPIGNLFASGLAALGLGGESAIRLHGYLYWAHAGAGLLLVASIPFTKLRHLFTGPLNILLRPRRAMGALEPIENIETAEQLGAGEIDEFPSRALVSFDACVQCGRCEDVCPAHTSGMPYSPRALLRSLHDQMHATLISGSRRESPALIGGAIERETVWQCTTCGACLNACPMFIDQVSALLELRRYLTLTTGDIPGSVAEALTQMERRGNPWGLPKENHAPWARELGLRVLQPGDQTDVLLFLGCAFGYDASSQRAGRALATLLQKADVDFALLGPAEGCCGETARRLGHEYLYQVMAEQTIAALSSVRFNRILTPCAHCFNTLKNEYPQFGGNFSVVHHSELLSELTQNGLLGLKAEGQGRALAYHDSCYLGRYNQIYQQPRAALDSIPRLKRVEMPRNLENSFCCGGGGGQMWMETDPNTRLNQRRIMEAVEDAKAEVMVTACPFCMIMFDDAIRAKAVGDRISVRDIAEVLAEHLDA